MYAAYQPRPGQHYKRWTSLRVEGIFGSFKLERGYYYHEGKKQGHDPADAALGLEMGFISFPSPRLKASRVRGANMPCNIDLFRWPSQVAAFWRDWHTGEVF